MQHHLLTIYTADLDSEGQESTELTSVSTDPNHDRPFLETPAGGVDAKVQLREGRAVIGQANVEILDVPTIPGDQGSGWFTALLSEGEQSQLIGHRAKLQRVNDDASTVTVIDGVIYEITLNDDLVSYTLQLRDIRERERRDKLFDRTSAVALPKGPTAGVSEPFDDDAETYTGMVLLGESASYSHYGGVLAQVFLYHNGTASDRWKTRVTPALESLNKEGRLPDGRAGFPHLEFWWRPTGSSAGWAVLRNMPSPSSFELTDSWGNPLELPHAWFTTAEKDIQVFPADGSDDYTEKGQVINSILLCPTATDPIPGHNQDVDLVVRYVGEPTEHYPFMKATTPAQLLKEIYRGEHSPNRTAPVRINEAAVDALDTGPDGSAIGMQLRVTKAVEDGRKWVEENIYRPLGAAPALDTEGRVCPVSMHIPTGFNPATLPELTPDNTESARWVQSSEVVNQVELTYRRAYLIFLPSDQWNKADGLGWGSQEVLEVYRAGEGNLNLHGEQIHKVNAGEAFAALYLNSGSQNNTTEAGHRLAFWLWSTLSQRFGTGGRDVKAVALHESLGRPMPGDFVRVSIPWLPNYGTAMRGGTRIMQVVSVREMDARVSEYGLSDCGMDPQPPEEVPTNPDPGGGGGGEIITRSIAFSDVDSVQEVPGFEDFSQRILVTVNRTNLDTSKCWIADTVERPADSSADWVEMTLTGTDGNADSYQSHVLPWDFENTGRTVHIRARGTFTTKGLPIYTPSYYTTAVVEDWVILP